MTFDKIRELLAQQFEVSADSISMETNIVDDLGASSLDLVDLAMSVEDEFGIEVPDELIETVQTVGDVVNFIEEN